MFNLINLELTLYIKQNNIKLYKIINDLKSKGAYR